MIARRARGVLFWAAVSAAAACLLASASCGLSIGYLTNGAPLEDAAAPDAVAPASDGGDGGDAGPWCGAYPTAFFCADFDEGSVLDAYENGGPVTMRRPNGDVSLSSDARSAPGALVASIPAIDAGTTPARFEEPVNSPPAEREEMRFDLRLPVFTPGTLIDLAALDMDGPSDARVRAFLSLTSDGRGELWLDNGAGGQQSAYFALPASLATTWHTFDLRLDLAPSPSAQVTIDGSQTPAAHLSAAAVGFTKAQSATFYLGLSADGPSAPLQALYDDVLVTTE
jgi:hypothetical protein